MSQAVKYVNDIYGSAISAGSSESAIATNSWVRSRCRPTFHENDGRLEVIANVRMPRGNTPEALRDEIEKHKRVGRGQARHRRDPEQDNWMAHDPTGHGSTLLNIFGDTTGLPASRFPPQAAPPPS